MAERRIKTAGKRFETLQLHTGNFRDQFGACSVPVYSSASFWFPDSKTGEKSMTNFTADAYVYSRTSNPTVHAFEQRIAALEGGTAAVAFSSGAAAVLVAVLSLARAGSNIVSTRSIHGGTYHQFHTLLSGLGIEARFVRDDASIDEIGQLIDENTRIVFTETIGNPKFTVADFDVLSEVAHRNGIPLVVDATFSAAGYFCRPIDHGADIVIHSATKWIGGHGTTLGGVIVDSGKFDWGASPKKFPQFHGGREGTADANLYKVFGTEAYAALLKADTLRDIGSTLSSQAAHELLIGLETLSLRAERQASNAMQLAQWLEKHPQVSWVQYLGLENHHSHQLALRYLIRGFGTVLAFGVKGGKNAALKLADSLELIGHTANVGDSKTILIHHRSTTHSQLTEEECLAIGVTDDLIRLSAGTEHIDDLKEDLDQAFAKVAQSESHS